MPEPRDLHHDAEVLDEENPAEHWDQKLLADGDGERGDGATECKAAGVAHEDLGREGIVPEEAHAGADKSGDEHYKFPAVWDEQHVEVFAEDRVARDISQDGEGQTDDGSSGVIVAVVVVIVLLLIGAGVGYWFVKGKQGGAGKSGSSPEPVQNQKYDQVSAQDIEAK